MNIKELIEQMEQVAQEHQAYLANLERSEPVEDNVQGTTVQA